MNAKAKSLKKNCHVHLIKNHYYSELLLFSAGPIFNFIFAIIAYWFVFIIGVNGLKPIIGDVEVGSISAIAGFKKGQEIISINNVITPTWSTAMENLVNYTVNGEVVTVKTKDSNDHINNVRLDLSKISIDEMAEGKLLEALGLSVVKLSLPAIIGEVLPNGSAMKSGLLKYDEIISANKNKVDDWSEWVKIVRSNPGRVIHLEVLRGDELIDISLIPAVVEQEGKQIGQIGAAVFNPEGLFDSYFTKESYSVINAIPKAISKTWDMSVLTLRILGKMLLGEASVKNLSGPISIAQYAGQSAGIGLVAFLGFMAIVSVSLGVLNLLPVPLLDGGHLMYYLVELLIGKPVSEATQILGQQIGLVLLLGLMSIAFYNDIARLLIQ